MTESIFKYIWRCAKCSNHLANVHKMEGMLKQEKKCPKCKSLNVLTLANKEIFIQCKTYDPHTNGYERDYEENFEYPSF